MYSAQLPGIFFHAEGFIDVEFMEGQLIDALAKDIAHRQLKWDPLDQLADEDVALLSKTLVCLRGQPIPRLQKGNSLVTSTVFAAANNAGLHLSLALQGPCARSKGGRRGTWRTRQLGG